MVDNVSNNPAINSGGNSKLPSAFKFDPQQVENVWGEQTPKENVAIPGLGIEKAPVADIEEPVPPTVPDDEIVLPEFDQPATEQVALASSANPAKSFSPPSFLLGDNLGKGYIAPDTTESKSEPAAAKVAPSVESVPPEQVAVAEAVSPSPVAEVASTVADEAPVVAYVAAGDTKAIPAETDAVASIVPTDITDKADDVAPPVVAAPVEEVPAETSPATVAAEVPKPNAKELPVTHGATLSKVALRGYRRFDAPVLEALKEVNPEAVSVVYKKNPNGSKIDIRDLHLLEGKTLKLPETLVLKDGTEVHLDQDATYPPKSLMPQKHHD